MSKITEADIRRTHVCDACEICGAAEGSGELSGIAEENCAEDPVKVSTVLLRWSVAGEDDRSTDMEFEAAACDARQFLFI